MEAIVYATIIRTPYTFWQPPSITMPSQPLHSRTCVHPYLTGVAISHRAGILHVVDGVGCSALGPMRLNH